MCSDQGALTETKAVRVSLLPDAVQREAFAQASRFRSEFYECLAARRDELFELMDAVLCADGAVRSPVDLTLLPEHRRGHGAMYGGLNRGRIDVDRLRTVLAGQPLPRFEGGRLVLAVDVSPWLRSDAPCSAERLFCHVYGRAKTASQFIPGWPYSFVAALEPGATSWTAILDGVRLGPTDDAWVLRGLPVELVGRVRSDRVMRLPKPPRQPGTNGRPSTARRSASPSRRPGPNPRSPRSPTPPTTARPKRRHGTGSTPGSPTVPHGWTTTANCPWSRAR